MAIGPIAGIAFFKINGMQYQLRGELEVQPNSTENDWIANEDLTNEFTQKAVTPYISGKFSDSGSLSIQQLNAVQGVTVTADLINGKTYTLLQAAPWGEFKLNTANGEIVGKFGGKKCFEQLSR